MNKNHVRVESVKLFLNQAMEIFIVFIYAHKIEI